MANLDSDANWVTPIVSQLILPIATRSASPERRVTFFWVAHVLRVCRPLRIAPPLVLLAVFLQPAQSESVLRASSPRASSKPPQSTDFTSGEGAHLLDRVLDVWAALATSARYWLAYWLF